MQPLVTESQLHRLVGPVCGETTRAARPAGVPTGGFGPRVQAMAAWGTGASHLSKRTTQCVMDELFGVAIRLGALVSLEQATARAVPLPRGRNRVA